MRSGLLCSMLLVASLVSAQTVDVRSFFRTALPDAPRPLPFGPSNLRSPLIEAFDLRTETDRFDLSRQEYTARLQFSTPGLVRARRELFATLRQAPDSDGLEARCDLIEDLHEAWIGLYLSGRRQSLNDSLARVLQDRERLYGLELGTMRLPYDDLLDLRTTRTALVLGAAELRGRDERLRRAFGLYGDSITFAGFPTPATISLLLGGPRQPVAENAERDFELALIEREISLERAEDRGVLDFLQFRYRGNPNDELQERFHLGVAFRIQNSGDRQLKLRSLELERQWLETNGRLEDQLNEARRLASRYELTEALDRYDFTASVLAEEAADLKLLAAAAQGSSAADPQLLLDVEKRRLQNQLRLLEAEADVLSSYLQWLEDSGVLCTGEPGQWLDLDRL